ncbi:hypothetical protein F5B22DRAFT_609072 [Xylaria bambusicola]|uniref:uncharacterized protein n=1 Tax=Xylaria bambusicola TaxID=326684 RepID=UPI002008C03E|nr:uncharacterized protein F5B22DRAFT_609072 [Xylaria bambusicola]KAI0514940.1 hypothetical protein F5B22DRAFT_609072 [Xylaria bambusicola]
MNTPLETSWSRQDTHWAPLNTWNQLAPRSYNRFLLCFEIPNERHAAAISHLESCAVKLGGTRPVLNSLLKVNTPTAHIKIIGQPKIPVQVYDINKTFGKTYTQLKEAGFPASAFIAPIFEVPRGDVTHALILRIYTIDGGLLLGIHLHHALGDGKAVDDVISWLSAVSRKEMYDGRSAILPSPFNENDHPSDLIDDEKLLNSEYIRQLFPERTLLTSPFSQNEESIGNIFVFKIATLNTIRSQMCQSENAGQPSISVILIALLWAHVVKARMDTGKLSNTREYLRLFTLVDVRKRVFSTDEADRYFGNAVEAALTTLTTADLLKVCGRTTVDTDFGILAKLVEPICRSVQASIREVDANFVRKRYTVFSRLQDPRRLVFDYFPNDAGCFMLNSWRYVGLNAEQKWSFPGVSGVEYPDAIRRASGEWNLPAAVILPARPDSGEVEVMVTTEACAMAMLLKDEGLMRLVTRVLG